MVLPLQLSGFKIKEIILLRNGKTPHLLLLNFLCFSYRVVFFLTE